MTMNWDISYLLDQWEYHPGQVMVRTFKARDGSLKIQLRVDLGVLQMNAEGRPDGKRPFGHESLLEHYRAQFEKFRKNRDSQDEFKLKPEDCAKLQQEAIQYHHRYICLFQLEDYPAVIRDTERNLDVFQFAEEHAETEELAWSLQQFKPQLLMMHTRAKASLALQKEDYLSAIHLIENGLENIRNFYHEMARHDLLEQSLEIQSLEAWLQEINSKRPLSEKEKLENALEEAVRSENYEKAAKVRDALRNLKARPSGS